MKPNSTASFWPNKPMRAPGTAAGFIQPLIVNAVRPLKIPGPAAMKLLLPLKVGALLTDSNPAWAGGRGPTVPRVTLVAVPFCPAPREPIFARAVPDDSFIRQ